MRTSLRLLALVPAALLALSGPTLPASADAGLRAPDLLSGKGVVVPAGAPALPTILTGDSWVVADADTGAVLAARDAHGSRLPASTLKVLTAITVIPRLDPAARVQPSQEDLNVDGTKVGLFRGYRYPVSTLLTAMLVVSANDAANTLATANGGLAVTAEQMNVEARRLGATGTNAVNPSGLDAAGQMSTAYDLALFGRAGLQLPDFRRYVATKNSTVPGLNGKQIAISTHDKLLFNYPGAIGIKNGYTVAAKATYIGAATRDGHTVLVTVMHAEPRIWPEVAALLDWGFAAERAGVTPVGQLAEPLDAGPKTTAALVAARITPVAIRRSIPISASSLPAVTAGGLGLLVLLMVVRRRRAVSGAAVSWQSAERARARRAAPRPRRRR